MRLFKEFHDYGEFVKNLNATFFVLVGGGGGRSRSVQRGAGVGTSRTLGQ